MIGNLIKLMRPWQWIKNTFVFLAMFFGGKLLDANAWFYTLIGFAALCLASSAIYCLNDICDAKTDKYNPQKCTRPIAAGLISPQVAASFGVVLGALSLILTFTLLPIEGFYVIVGYLLMNALYCLWLKHIPLIDLFIIAMGFELRLILGGISSDTILSTWIVIMVFLLSFFLALAKRRDELVMSQKSNNEIEVRKSVSQYNIRFIDVALSIICSVMLIAYIIYTIQPETIAHFGSSKLYVTSLFVLCGILRYLQITIVANESSDPTMTIYKDRALQLTLLGWIASFTLIIYG